MTSNNENNINNDDENICFICFDNKKMKEFKCGICKKTICINCFNNIKIRRTEAYYRDDKYLTYDYKCPICCNINKTDITNFTKEEILRLSNNDFYYLLEPFLDKYKNFPNLFEVNDKLTNENDDLKEKILRLEDEIKRVYNDNHLLNIKNEELKLENNELKLKNNDLKDKLLNNNEEHNNIIFNKDETHKQQILFLSNCMMNQSNNLKYICNLTKTKTINKNLLKPLYEGVVNITMKI